MQKTILIIDDDDMLRSSLAKGLRAADFSVVTADSAEFAEKIMDRIIPDAIVLDRMMTGIDGLSALRGWRARGIKAPVIMLTALSGPENAIDGLESGADDYLAKPFQLKELILRLNNVMKNADAFDTSMPKGLRLADGEFFIDDGAEHKLLALSLAESRFLKELASPVGNIASVPPMVAKRLREKLRANLKNADIITVRGKGYKIVISEK
ncbi:MAG: response regulator transcription factor [Rickettsiales bacterium]|jgi:DNA-binding response OmpR family regulator|nr:response regulator transcription factor [Rickettsiales bacterium]